MSDVNGVAQDQLRSFVERIERLEEEKKTIGDDIKEVYAEAKGNGFDTKILRRVISLRKKDPDERQEEEAILDLYLSALGMNPDLPFGDDELPIQRRGREPKPGAGRRRHEDEATVSVSFTGADGEEVTTPPVDLATFRKAVGEATARERSAP